MKTTEYFLRTRSRPDRAGINLRWIQQAIDSPLREEIQSDGRIRRWGTIPDLNGRYLRMVLLADGETVHNAFIDSGFRP